MNVMNALFAVIILVLLSMIGVSSMGLYTLFSVAVPYAAVSLFIIGVVYRVLKWASAPVPFRITTTCGQQKTLPWIKSSYLDNPHNLFGVLGRMALEVLTFRSLFRNSKIQRAPDGRLVFGSNQLLWLGALAFHYSLLVVLLRHFRFFVEPTPFLIGLAQELDGFLQIGAPRLYLTSVVIVAALGYLLLRRLLNPQIRYLSLPSDYFALFLLLGIALSGDLMRYFTKVDVVKVKELALGLVSFRLPSLETMKGIGLVFYVHLFLVSVLVAYFPVSKLMHLGGVFLSPTRNLANNNRRRRHVNPWNAPVPVHTYEEWEDDFRDKMKVAGIPVDKKE